MNRFYLQAKDVEDFVVKKLKYKKLHGVYDEQNKCIRDLEDQDIYKEFVLVFDDENYGFYNMRIKLSPANFYHIRTLSKIENGQKIYRKDIIDHTFEWREFLTKRHGKDYVEAYNQYITKRVGSGYNN